MVIEYIPINEIIPYERNPRKNDKAVPALKASIMEFGFRVPLVIDKNNVIVAGHTRHKAAKALGMRELPCIRADDLSEDQVKAFRLADNKTQEIALWDVPLVLDELKDIGDVVDMDQFGFDAFVQEEPTLIRDSEDDYEDEVDDYNDYEGRDSDPDEYADDDDFIDNYEFKCTGCGFYFNDGI